MIFELLKMAVLFCGDCVPSGLSSSVSSLSALKKVSGCYLPWARPPSPQTELFELTPKEDIRLPA